MFSALSGNGSNKDPKSITIIRLLTRTDKYTRVSTIYKHTHTHIYTLGYWHLPVQYFKISSHYALSFALYETADCSLQQAYVISKS